MTELRTKTGETVAPKEIYYGQHLSYIPYEDGIDDFYLDYFEISDNLPKVPNKLWNKLISVFYDYANQQLEVHARIVYNELSNDWKVVIPYQEVTGSSASYNYTLAIDLESGKQLNYPTDIPDYECIWHIHSHNTMDFKEPSSIDDKDELGTKQGYCVISNIDLVKRTYVCCFTIVSNNNRDKKNRRYFIADEDVSKIVEDLELLYEDRCLLNYQHYHIAVNLVIHKYVPVVAKVGTYKKPNYSWKQDKQVDKYWDNFDWSGTKSTIYQCWNVDDEIKDLILTFGVDEVVAAINKYTK